MVFASDILTSDNKFKKGRQIYSENCTMCHGENGDGNGHAAAAIKNPKPCDFTVGKFKYGSNLKQIIKTITEGVPNTAMPAWNNLSDEEKTAVAQYILKLQAKKP